jgi:hypothetical protein
MNWRANYRPDPRNPSLLILCLTLATLLASTCGCDQFRPLTFPWASQAATPKPVADVSPASPKAASANPDTDALAKQAEANAQRIEQGLASAKDPARRLNSRPSDKLVMPTPAAGPLEPGGGTLDPAAADATAPGSASTSRPIPRSASHNSPASRDKPPTYAAGPPPAVVNSPGDRSITAAGGPPVVLASGPVLGSGGLSASIPASTGSPAGSANSPAAIPSNAASPTNPSTGAAGSATSAALPAKPASGSLTDAIAQAEKLAASQPNDFRAQWQLRLLYLAAGRAKDAQAAWAGGSASDQKTLSAWVEAAIALEATRTPNTSATDPHDTALAALEQLRQHEADQAALKVRTVKLATRVDGFGILTPLDTDSLRPGQWVIVYSELDNLTSKMQSDNLYRCELALRIELLSAEGKSLVCQEDKQVIDRSLNPRRDFFLARRMCLPPDMPPGQYVLRVSVEDRQANKVGESMLRFGIK